MGAKVNFSKGLEKIFTGILPGVAAGVVANLIAGAGVIASLIAGASVIASLIAGAGVVAGVIASVAKLKRAQITRLITGLIKRSINPDLHMIFMLLVILVFLTSLPASPALALDEPQGQLVLSAGTLQGIVPQGRAMLRGENVGFAGRYASLPYSWEGYSGRLNLWQISGRIYSPISYRDTDFYLEGGISRAAYNVEGLDISSPAYQASLGFERDITSSFSWGGEIGYLYLPPEELNSQFLAGITINFSLPIEMPAGETAAGSSRNGPEHETEKEDTAEQDSEEAEIVRAEGTIDGVSVPYRVSGTWSFTANFAENTASLSVSGDSQDGSFSHSISGTPERRGSSISFTASQTGTHGGKEVTYGIRVRVNPSSLSVRVNARREDGLQMSGSGSGTTTSFDN